MDVNAIVTFLSSNFPTVMSVVGSVTGALFTAIYLRNNTSVVEFEKIKAGKFDEVINSLIESGKMTYMEFYKAKNFLEIAKKADEFYSEVNSEKTSSEYDFDWFIRFYEEAGNISDEIMQNLWAKILAGEIARPQSYSLKTIDVLRNMNKKDAELFKKICEHSFVGSQNLLFLPNDDKYLKKCGIAYTDVMKMNEQGLLFSNGSIGFSVTVDNKEQTLLNNKELLMTIKSDNKKEERVHIQEYPFTGSGMELATLITESANNTEFIEYGKFMNEEKNNYKVSIYKIINIEENSVRYEPKNLIE